MVEYKVIIVGELEVNCYLIYSNDSGKCFIVDPGDESMKVSKAVNELDLTPESVILTHAHIDHSGGISPFFPNLISHYLCMKMISLY